MLVINEDDVKRILGNSREMLHQIHNRVLSFHDELMDVDSLIRSAAFKQIRTGDTGGGGSGIKKDLLDVMLKHERLAMQRELEIRNEMYRLMDDEESINRVRVCFEALRGQEYGFLEQLYVKHIPYKTVERNSGCSHKTFEKFRRRGIEKIIQLYNSDFSNLEIIELGTKKRQLGCQ